LSDQTTHAPGRSLSGETIAAWPAVKVLDEGRSDGHPSTGEYADKM
jgi:hypothetical protein